MVVELILLLGEIGVEVFVFRDQVDHWEVVTFELGVQRVQFGY